LEFFKKIVRKYLDHFYYFYSYLGYKIFVSLGISLAVGFLDGFGLAMMLPLLQMVDGNGTADPESLGNLSFLIEGLQEIGVPITLRWILVVMLILFVLKGVAKFIDSFYRVILQQGFIRRLRFANVDKLCGYRYKNFVTADSGRIQNTLSGEITKVVSAYKYYFLTFQGAVLLFVYIFMAFLANPQFALLVVLGSLLSNGIYGRIYRKTKQTSRKITSDGHIFQGLLIQMVAFFKYLKATGYNKVYASKLKKSIVQIELSTRKIGFYNSILTSTREPIIMMIVVGVILIQIEVFGQTLSVLILSLIFFYRALTFLINIQIQWNSFMNVSGSLENMTEFMNDLGKHQEKQGVVKFTGLHGQIEARELSFNYRSTSVLKDVSLGIKKNETVAFVGESGSGKTTLVNLLAGLMPPSAGAIEVDGMDLKEMSLDSYRSRIGYITQEPVIFSDSVFNNVTFWDEKSSTNVQRFRDALQKAAILDFVNSLPQREDTYLGSSGITVSGGQKQRLSIARELYKNVDILIMDEATSALDSETEREIQWNIDLLKGHFTILMIAHRLSTVKNADKIVLLKNGRIEAVNSFNEMVETSASFKKMVQLQEF
jgi:ABC-type multidrug transport system fused ATPase/permease subunit